MLNPPSIRIVIPRPVAMLEVRRQRNRATRRRLKFGKQHDPHRDWDGFE